MENKSHAMAAGTFVLVLTALLAGLWLWLSRDQQAYVRYEMSTNDAISGLQEQATVRYKGVAVGKVVDINFDAQNYGHVLIEIQVEDDAPISPSGTYAMLGYQGVTGIAHIQLDDVKEPTIELPRGPSGLPRLPMKSSPLSVLADQGMTILSKVNEATERINQLLGDENQVHFTTLLGNVSEAASNVSALTQSLNSTVREHIAPAMQQVPSMAQDARRAMQALESTGHEAKALVQEVRGLAANIQGPGGALEQVTQGTQSIARAAERLDRATLPAIGQAGKDVSSAARQLGSVVSGIGDNPQSLLYGTGPVRPGPGEPGFVVPTPSR